MTKEQLQELLINELRVSNDDICRRCSYEGKATCARGNQHVDEDGELYWDNPNEYATETCVMGMYEYFKTNKKQGKG